MIVTIDNREKTEREQFEREAYADYLVRTEAWLTGVQDANLLCESEETYFKRKPNGRYLDSSLELAWRLWQRARKADRPIGYLEFPTTLNRDSMQLVLEFAAAMAEKMKAAEIKYGYDNDWKYPDWMEGCQKQIKEHLEKGDPRDVAIYAAFCWYHKWSTNGTTQATSR